MPVNKNALLRFQILDRCFRGGRRKLDASELLIYLNEELNRADQKPIRRRQLYDDINAMKEIVDKRIDILSKRDGRRSYFEYSDPDYSVFNLPLSPEEEELLEPALAMLASVAGAPQVESVKKLLPSIQSRLRYKEMGSDIMHVEANMDLKGVEHLQTLYVAIRKQQVLDIVYRDFKAVESYPIRFHPHILKQFNGRWFVLGTNVAKADMIWVMSLDRVESIDVVPGDYLSSSTDWIDYFDEIIGVSNPLDRPVLKIRLRFTADRLPFVLTKPLHGSQRIAGPNEITIEVKRNFELESAILFFGDDVEVLEPEELRERIESRWRNAIGN
jgi:predicted DNA-binding transcriptional regulator YafY